MLFDPADLELDPLTTYFRNGRSKPHVLPEGSNHSLCSRAAVLPHVEFMRAVPRRDLCVRCAAKAAGKVTPKTAMLNTLRSMAANYRQQRRLGDLNAIGVRLFETAIRSMAEDLRGMGLGPLADQAVGNVLRERA